MPVLIPDGYCGYTMDFLATNAIGGRMYWTGGLDLGSNSLGDAAVSLFSAFDDNVTANMSDNVQLESVRTFSETATAEATGEAPGERVIVEPPPNTSLLIRKVTAQRGPRGRGRMYPLGLFSEGEVNEQGVIDESVVSDLQDDFTAFFASLTTDGNPMVILQNSDGVSPPVDPPPPVTALLVQSKCATQRRRLR